MEPYDYSIPMGRPMGLVVSIFVAAPAWQGFIVEFDLDGFQKKISTQKSVEKAHQEAVLNGAI